MKHNTPILRGTVVHEAYPDSRDDGLLTNNKILTTDASGNLEVRTLPEGVPESNAPIYRGNDITLDSTYNNETVIMSGEFSQVVTVPLEATESIDVGFSVTIVWRRKGDITITPEGGVTIYKDANEDLVIRQENEAITLIKEATNEWGIYGALLTTGGAGVPWTFDDMLVAMTPVVDTVITKLAWPNIEKSSDWPEFTTTQDYFCIYGDDHHVTQGVYWGEMDDLLFTNFNERGKLIDNGFFFETPRLFRVPSGESLVTTDDIWIIGHDVINPVENFGVNGNQQTRIFTTVGGDTLHASTWTDRGTPYGYDAVQNPRHTGYAEMYRRGDGDWISTHSMASSVNGIDWSTQYTDSWISTAVYPEGPWTLVHPYLGNHPLTELSPYPQFYGQKMITFEGTDFIVGHVDSNRIAIFDTWDAYLQPLTIVAQSQLIDGFHSLGWYYPSAGGNFIWLITKKFSVPLTDPFRIYKYDLREVLG